MDVGNFLQWGANALYASAALCTDVEVQLSFGGESVAITGTLTQNSSLLDPSKVKIQSHRYYFITDTVELGKTLIPIQRGTEVKYNGDTFEVVIEPKGTILYNDPHEIRTILVLTKKATE
jgi:hypothetical protein